MSSESNGNGAAESAENETPETASSEQAPQSEDSAEESTESRIETLEAARSKLKDQLLRTAADFENFRKRAKRDVEEADRRAREETFREMLPIIDNLERAVEASGSAVDVEAVAEGVRMVLKLFEDVCGRLYVERVESVGARFDPSLHDAVQQMETAEHPPGTIVAEVVPGYRIKDRLLRAALVVVARPPAAEKAAGVSEEEG